MRRVSIATCTLVEPVSVAFAPNWPISSCLASFVRGIPCLLAVGVTGGPSPARRSHASGRGCGLAAGEHCSGGESREMRPKRAAAGVAAGHTATARVGLSVLEGGGSAVDAAVAASLASCVAETVMTGLLGGGFALVWDATRREASVLDFFVAVPGLGVPPREPELVELAVPFGEELVHYAIGPASCAVPGVVPGLRELLRAHGTMAYEELAAPAAALAREGVP